MDRLAPQTRRTRHRSTVASVVATVAIPCLAVLTAAVAASLLIGCATTPPATAASPTGTGTQPGAAAATAEPAPTPLLDDDWRDEILYFVIVDRWANGDRGNDRNVDPTAPGTFHGGDLAGLIAHLDELDDLGVTALWITPVVQQIPGFVTGAGFPDWGYHGYWADDFYAIDPRFGTEAQLAELVRAAHGRGIKVILDVVYNHPGYDSRYVTSARYRGWTRSEDRGNCGNTDETLCLLGLPDFRTELDEVRRYLLDAHLSLARRTGLDGFRLDTVKHVEHDFWRQHRAEVDGELGEDFFLLGEVWGGDAQVLDPYFESDELDAGFDFGFGGSTVAFVQGRGRAVAYNHYLTQRHETRDGYLLSHYLSSHDVPGALYELDGDVELFRLAAILQMTVWGLPTIYYGEEVARAGGDWPENRSDFPWGERDVPPGAGEPRNEELRADYQRLITLRRAHPALWRGDHTMIRFDEEKDEQDLLVFRRHDAGSGGTVVVAVNRGDAPATGSFDAPAGWSGTVRDVWNGETVPVEDGRLRLTVPPREARIVTTDDGQEQDQEQDQD